MLAGLKRLISPVWPVVALFTAATLLDLVLQMGERTQIEEFFDNRFLSALACAGVSIKWGLLLSAPVLLLGRHSRWVLCPLWGWIVFVETVECVARRWYGMSLDGDWLMIMLTSSSSEMEEFLGQFGVLALVAVPLCAALAFAGGLTLLLRLRYPNVSKGSVVAGILSCVPFVASNLVLGNPLSAANETMYAYLPVDTVHNYAMYMDLVRTATSPRLPPAREGTASRAGGVLGVFAIGESATRSHWHMYGYSRPTTPVMDGLRDELVVFRDVRALHSTTGKSLRMMLTEATADSPHETRSTFSQQCAAAGYGCSLLSAHSRWGRWDGVESLIFSGCGERRYLNELPDAGVDLHDDALLPMLDAVVSGPSSAMQIVFLHLMGSHAPPLLRYPLKRSIYPRHDGDFAPGVKEAESIQAVMADTYDNSIAFTDLLLGQVIDRLKATGRPSFLVYVSDHGETPGSGFWRDKSSPDLFEVPCVVWFSKEYRALHPEVVAAISAMADGMLMMDRLLPVFRRLALLE